MENFYLNYFDLIKTESEEEEKKSEGKIFSACNIATYINLKYTLTYTRREILSCKNFKMLDFILDVFLWKDGEREKRIAGNSK